MAMRNAILYIDRKDAHLPEGSFFLADVMGMEVRDAKTGEILGNIATCSPSPPTTSMWSGAEPGRS